MRIAAIVIIIHLLFLIVLLLLLPKSSPKPEPTVYIIGSGKEQWPASYWNWFSSQYNWKPNASRFGGYGGWGSRPHHRLIAGPGYKPAGNYGPRYSDRRHH